MRKRNKEFDEVRKWLRHYRRLEKDIKAREIHRQEFIDDIYNPLKASQLGFAPCGSGKSDQTYQMIERIENKYKAIITIYESMLDDMLTDINALLAAKKELDDAINSLEGYERSVIYHKYVLGVKWEDMNTYIGYDERQCRRIEISALKRLMQIMNRSDVSKWA